MKMNAIKENESDGSRSDIDENFDDASGDFAFEPVLHGDNLEIKREIDPEIQQFKNNENKETVDVGSSTSDVILEEPKEIDENIIENVDNIEEGNQTDSSPTESKEKKCDLCKYFYSIGKETFIVHAQEPWPKDVKLFQPYEIEQILLPDNANCLAVQAFLKMCNLDFQIEYRPNAEFMSPTGKVPFIKCGAFVIAELEGIVHFVGEKGISLSEYLENEHKSDLRAYMALINNVLGNAESYVCWCDAETYREVTKPRNGSVYPWPLNHIQTWTKRSKEVKRLKTLGWYDKTLEEVFQEVKTCCQALTDRLENNTYFFGNKFTELDALTYGHIFTILNTKLPGSSNQLAFHVKKFDKLVNHCKRIDMNIMGHDVNLNIIVETKEDDFADKTESVMEIVRPGEPDIKETDWVLDEPKVEVDCIGDGP